jgi:hypothetical protein
MNFRTCSALRQAVAVAVVVAGCATTQEAPETYAWAPVRPPAVPGTGLPTPGQPGQVRPQPLPRSSHKRVLPSTREPGLWAGDAPRASQELEANPTPKGLGRDWLPPVDTTERRPECRPVPVRHLGGNDLHDTCADRVPQNGFPGWDVLVNGKHFDALQMATRTLWEVKTTAIETYNPFVLEIELDKQVKEARRERALAAACGYDFVIGVRSEVHKDLLEARLPGFNIVLMTWC